MTCKFCADAYEHFETRYCRTCGRKLGERPKSPPAPTYNCTYCGGGGKKCDSDDSYSTFCWACDKCDGTGKNLTQEKMCPACDGYGYLKEENNPDEIFLDVWERIKLTDERHRREREQTCPTCKGSRRVPLYELDEVL